MTTLLALREYQTESISEVWEAWNQGIHRPAVVLPTGMGKTVIFASMIDTWLRNPFRTQGAVLVLVHREELADQTAEKIAMINPDISVGVVKAGRNELQSAVIIGSVQTLARENRRRQLPPVAVVIVDECHHASADSYLKILNHTGALPQTTFAGQCRCGQRHGSALAVGFTATMGRTDKRGLGNVWQEVVYSKDIPWGIHHNDDGPCAPGDGYLTDVRGYAIEVDGLDLTRVAVRQGDLADGSLGDAMLSSGAGQVIAERYKELAEDRQGIVFMPTVATAHGIAEDFNAVGIPTAVVDGTTTSEDRKLIYKRMRAGDLQAIANCGVLTEGFDMPRISAIVTKMTSSQMLYTQMIGRGLRPWPGKTDCLVLDPTGTSSRLPLAGPADLSTETVEPRDGESLGEAMRRAALEEAEKAATAAERKAKRALIGKVSVRQIDLFHGSRSAWLQTYKGVWFIPTRNYTFFLWPDGDEGHWKIGRCGVYSTKGGQWLRGRLTLEYAMAMAERQAKEEDPTISQRDASWRRDKNISDGQRGLAERYGIEIGQMRKGEVSDAISVHIASRILDRGKR